MQNIAHVGRACLPAILLAGLIAPVAVTGNPDDTAVLDRTSAAFSAIADRAIPAVVYVEVEKNVGAPPRTGGRAPFGNAPHDFFDDDLLRRFFQGPQMRRFEPRRRRQQGTGSGFIMSPDGYILTNSHVVEGADKIRVKLHDGREFKAEPIGSDTKSEVAVIKIDADDLPTIPLGDSGKLRIGEWVIAIGNPLGLAETLTVGVVSAKGRSNIGIADYEDFIQTDAAINPGNSGGPLLNSRGEVVGVNTAISTLTGGYMGIGFAIPINMARDIKNQLVEHGKVVRGYLGILIQEVTPDLASSFGLDENAGGILVGDVVEDSAAEKGGLEQGDVITKLDGEDVDDVAAFRNKVASSPPGTKFTLDVIRDGKQHTFEIATGTLTDEVAATSAATPEISEELGLQVGELTDELAERFGYEQDEGVLVTHVEPGGPAAAKGLRPGDLIASVNREPVRRVAQFNRAIGGVEPGEAVLLRVKNGDHYRFVAIRLE